VQSPREYPAQLFAEGLGVSVFAAGVLLFIGNITGLFPTIPFAGYITMAIGSAMIRVAMKT
jgi:hypothetical protein